MAQETAPKPGMTTCVRCRKAWGGLKTAHCTGCCETFTTISSFDKHRTGSHSQGTRHCLAPAAVGLVDAGRGYPCWGFAGDDSVRWGDDSDDAA